MSPILIGVSACEKSQGVGESAIFTVGAKYVRGLFTATQCIPVIIPPMGQEIDLDGLLDRLDGLMLTGSPSNVEPQHYQGDEFRQDVEKDPARDHTTLPLIKKALARKMPILGICRGLQEINVALGGSLEPYLWETANRCDHRRDPHKSFDEQYLPSHDIIISNDGYLSDRLGAGNKFKVNSLHGQAIKDLASGLRIEAMSDDQVIEAVSLKKEDGFLMAVQWHPEHSLVINEPINQAPFKAFQEAVKASRH